MDSGSSIYERALSEIGQDGTHQIKFDIIYNVVFAGLWAMAYNNIILAVSVIPHTCKLLKKPDNISAYVWKLKYIPT